MTDESESHAVPSDPRLDALVERLARLEERLERLERQAEPTPDAPPTPDPPPSGRVSLWATGGRPIAPAAGSEVAQVDQVGYARMTHAAPAATAPREPLRSSARVAGHADETELGFSVADLERLLTGRVLAIVGGVALVIGAAFFLSLAFSRGWITPPARVGIGLIAGSAGLALGGLLLERRPSAAIVGHVLVASGLGAISLALFAATRLYGLFPPELGIAAALVSAVAAAVVAIRTDSQAVAAFGLIAVLGSPPLLGASATGLTLAFLAAALVGTTILALARTWTWLPTLAFFLTAPQIASWLLTDADIVAGLAIPAGFCVLTFVAAGGRLLREPAERMRDEYAVLVLVNAVYWVACAFVLLRGTESDLLAMVIALIGVAHLGTGLLYARRRGERDPFSMIVAAIGVAALTLAVPLQFDGPAVAVLWASGALALALVWSSRDHEYAGMGCIALAGLAAAHLLFVEYPGASLPDFTPSGVPFANASGATLALFVAALLFAARYLLHDPIGRRGALVAAVVLVAWAIPFELTRPLSAVAWCVAGVLALQLASPRVPDAPVHVSVAGVLVALAAGLCLTSIVPPDRLIVRASEGPPPYTPFVNESSLALAAVASALAWATRSRVLDQFRGLIWMSAAVVLLYLVSVGVVDAFQARIGEPIEAEELGKQAQVALSVLWAMLGAVAFALGLQRRWAIVRQAGLALLLLATTKVFLVDLAALDVAYRVISLIGLGVLLLVSAYVYQRIAKPVATEGPRGDANAHD